MKYKLFALAIFLLAPIVAQPERISISSCDPRVIIRYGRNIEGQATEQTVGIIVPCVSKADLAKLFQNILAAQKPEVEERAIQALHHATDVSIALTTKLDTHQQDQ
jgi:hypothetical protein